MSTTQDIIDSLGIHLMSDSPVFPDQNFDTAISRLGEAVCGVTTLDLSTGGAANFIATAAQTRGAVLILSGATASRNIVLENLPFRRLFVNASTFSITVKHSATVGVLIAPNTTKILWSDGVTVKSASEDFEAVEGLFLPEGGTTGQVLKKNSDDDGDVVWAIDNTGGGGGGGSSLILPLDVAPVSPSAYDDEFESETLDPKWRLLMPTTAGTSVIVRDGMTIIEPADAGTSNLSTYGGFGVVQDISGTFTAMAKIRSDYFADDARAGLIAASSTGGGLVWGCYDGTGRSSPGSADSFNLYSENSSFGSFGGHDFGIAGTPVNDWVWFRLIYDGTTLSYAHSLGGITWRPQGTFALAGVDRIGLGMVATSQSVAANHKLLADWFRVETP